MAISVEFNNKSFYYRFCNKNLKQIHFLQYPTQVTGIALAYSSFSGELTF